MKEDRPKPVRSEQPAAKPIAAAELFDGRREVQIEFQRDIYRLRITRNDKLILTK